MTILRLDEQTDIYYETIDGDAERPVLVFLHEGLGCTAMWKGFPGRLCEATGCAGLIYDRQGYGHSTPLAGKRTVHYLHDAALRELPAVLSALVDNRDYFVIGHSDGGSIGLLHAAEQPARLRGLMVEAAHVSVEQESLDGIRLANESFAAGKLSGLARYHGSKTEQIFRAWADTWLEDSFRHWSIEYALPSICCPVLAMQGVDDQYGTPAQVDTIVTRAENAEFAEGEMIPDCAHTPHLEQADAVMASMQSFIQRCLTRPPNR